MRILQLAPPWQPVPGSSGPEYLVPGLLSDELVRDGHHVTLAASGESRTTATLLDLVDGHANGRIGDLSVLVPHVLAAYQRRSGNDLVHDHTELGPALATFVDDTPSVHTLHYPLTDARRLSLGLVGPHVWLVAVSRVQAGRAGDLPIAAVIPYGVATEHYPLATSTGGYLAFVGSARPGGGAEEAINVAERLGVRLRIALDVSSADEREHWASTLRPSVDGPRFEVHLNPGRTERIGLIGRADALLVTADGDDPFPLGAIEANACGTPVVGFALGALPEVVEDGVTGFLIDAGDTELLCAATERASWLDRAACRSHVDQHFSARRMVTAYHAVYGSAIDTAGNPVRRASTRTSDLEGEGLLRWASTLLTTAGHDLKGSLGAIVGLASVLVEHGAVLDPATRSGVQDRLLARCLRLQGTLDDLLELRHLMRRVHIDSAERVDLVTLVRDVAIEVAVDERRLDLNLDLQVTEFWADRLSVKHILTNLLSNGLRFAGESSVTVRSFADPNQPDTTVIAVEDRGPGVTDDRKHTLFEPTLEKAHDGIGLAIVSALTQLEGGTVQVLDRPGGGASFRVALPSHGPLAGISI